MWESIVVMSTLGRLLVGWQYYVTQFVVVGLSTCLLVTITVGGAAPTLSRIATVIDYSNMCVCVCVLVTGNE